MSGAGHIVSGDDGKGRQGPFLILMRKVTDMLDWSGRIIVAACLAAMFIALLVNVVLRYFFGDGIARAYEIHALLLPWMVAGGLVIASARGRNITITLMSDLLKGRALSGLNVIVHATILLICITVLWSSQPILKASQFQTLSTLGIKQIWGYSSLLYAFGAMALIAVLDLLRILAGEDASGRAPLTQI